jgi:hypothetical protein
MGLPLKNPILLIKISGIYSPDCRQISHLLMIQVRNPKYFVAFLSKKLAWFVIGL